MNLVTRGIGPGAKLAASGFGGVPYAQPWERKSYHYLGAPKRPLNWANKRRITRWNAT